MRVGLAFSKFADCKGRRDNSKVGIGKFWVWDLLIQGRYGAKRERIGFADWECLAMNVLVSGQREVREEGYLGIGVFWMQMKGAKGRSRRGICEKANHWGLSLLREKKRFFCCWLLGRLRVVYFGEDGVGKGFCAGCSLFGGNVRRLFVDDFRRFMFDLDQGSKSLAVVRVGRWCRLGRGGRRFVARVASRLLWLFFLVGRGLLGRGWLLL